MKVLNPIRLSVGLVALFVAQAGWAAGTEAGTVVENTAKLSYSVGSVNQPEITSETAKFTVDQKIDLTVSGSNTNNYIVSPSSTQTTTSGTTLTNVLKYKLKNDGNLDQDFKITASHLASEDFDAIGCEITKVENDAATPATVNPVAGSYPAAIGTGVTVNVPADAEYEIHVACNMPAPHSDTNTSGVIDGYLSTVEVLAMAVDGSGTRLEETATDNIGGTATDIDIVLADGIGGAADQAITPNPNYGSSAGDRNASHSTTQTYEIDAPELSVVKTSVVISDPINNSTNPKRIPGAVIEYTITITNASDKAPDPVTVTDAIDTTNLTFVSGSIKINGTSAADSLYAIPTLTATSVEVPKSDENINGGNNGEATVIFRATVN